MTVDAQVRRWASPEVSYSLMPRSGDGSTDPAEIPRFDAALRDGADFAKGTRLSRGGGSTDVTRLRVWSNHLLKRIHGARKLDASRDAFRVVRTILAKYSCGRRSQGPQWCARIGAGSSATCQRSVRISASRRDRLT